MHPVPWSAEGFHWISVGEREGGEKEEGESGCEIKEIRKYEDFFSKITIIGILIC